MGLERWGQRRGVEGWGQRDMRGRFGRQGWRSCSGNRKLSCCLASRQEPLQSCNHKWMCHEKRGHLLMSYIPTYVQTYIQYKVIETRQYHKLSSTP